MNDVSDIQEPLDGIYIIDGKVLFNVVLNEIIYESKVFKIAYTESKTLLLLIHHSGEIVPRDRIIEYGWAGRVVSDASLAKSISNLRRVLRECTLDIDSILTVPRMGYRFTLSAELYSSIANEYSNKNLFSEVPESNDESFTKEMSESVDGSLNEQCLPLVIHDQVSKKVHSHFIESLRSNIDPGVKRTIRWGMYILSFTFFFIALHQIRGGDSNIFDSEFISKGYKKSLVTIDNKHHAVIYMSGTHLTEDVLSAIALSPADSTVFYRADSGVVNLSFFVKRRAISFAYQENNFIKAKCVIRQALLGGGQICER
ncbi:MAG: winged helix-turn-helix domain-containing protein [Shewanella sp.]